MIPTVCAGVTARAENFLPDAFGRELRIAEFLMNYPDLPEGIRAQIIDRDRNPAWFATELTAEHRQAIADVVLTQPETTGE